MSEGEQVLSGFAEDGVRGAERRERERDMVARDMCKAH